MDQFTEYITIQNDRLDSIANKAYGDPFNWEPILNANPTLPIMDLYDAGIRLMIPVVVPDNSNPTKELLPPWKQQ